MVGSRGRFVWYELMTTDAGAAKAFYAKVMGWGIKCMPMPGAIYTLFSVGKVPVGGLMELPENASKMGAPAHWVGYVGVDDVDVAVERVKQLGGAVHIPPTDVPGISRFSVIADPQMATFALIRGLKLGREQLAELGAPAHVGWHELLAADWEKALAFYGKLFGWRKADAHVGSMGTYQKFSLGGETRPVLGRRLRRLDGRFGAMRDCDPVLLHRHIPARLAQKEHAGGHFARGPQLPALRNSRRVDRAWVQLR